ncbi:dihydroxyacetone kinase subunit L [Streptomyces sp. N2-109]|uniref:Dihydroxyacetone kinase subunit L n=1 Tax=Streptomyces gossypii TaxID=2883101 RepID=A0ABT2JMV9_9ACTN|nr:dihydroxyacetone kinase subunit DhaL [Streptomyces gossypii]MCT2589076.1 dihydroxyacetone kinase subunit L [Streptomyces gossypii]
MDIALARTWVQAIAAAVDAQKDQLTQLDSAIGDADHGANMQRGFVAATAALAEQEPAGPGDVLVKTGSTLISSVGGASGPLYGSVFRAIGKTLAGAGAGSEPAADARRFADALSAGLESLQRLGAAAVGDKTMVDAYVPALEAFQQAAEGAGDGGKAGDFAAAARAAAEAAEEGMRATTPLQARKGRASYLGTRSVGHQDPGATSTALIFRALADVTAAVR